MAAGTKGTRKPGFAEWTPTPVGHGGWPPGGALFRCHLRTAAGYDGNQFNPTDRPKVRFSPTYTSAADEATGDPVTVPVPAWYGASSPEAAVAEVLLHDIPVKTGGNLPAAKFANRVVTKVTPRRPLRLLRLDTDGLRSLGLNPKRIVDADADLYDATRTTAQTLYHQHRPDGLAWMSRRRNIDTAVVLYSPKVSAADLEITEQVLDFNTLDGWSWLHNYVTPLRIRVSPPPGY